MTNTVPIRPRWVLALKDARRVGARTPAIANGTIYQVFHYDKGSGFESALLAVDIRSGAERWRSLIGHVANEPVVGSDGTIYVSSFEGSVYAFAPDGAVLWRAPAAERNMGAACLAGPDRILVAETGGGSRKTWCLDARSGDVLWSFENGGHSYPISATADIAVHATAVSTENFGETAIRLFALSVKDGHVLWSVAHDQYLFGSAMVGEHIVIGARGGVRVYALRDGRLEAELAIPDETAAQTVRSESAGLLVVDDTRRLRVLALGQKRGLFRSSVELTERWVTELPAEPAGKPIELEKGIAILTADGVVHVIDKASGGAISSMPMMSGIEGVGGLARVEDLLIVSSGRTLLAFETSNLAPTPGPQMTEKE